MAPNRISWLNCNLLVLFLSLNEHTLKCFARANPQTPSRPLALSSPEQALDFNLSSKRDNSMIISTESPNSAKVERNRPSCCHRYPNTPPVSLLSPTRNTQQWDKSSDRILQENSQAPASSSNSDAPPVAIPPPASSSGSLGSLAIVAVALIVILALCIVALGTVICWSRFRRGRRKVGSSNMRPQQGTKGEEQGEEGARKVIVKSVSKTSKKSSRTSGSPMSPMSPRSPSSSKHSSRKTSPVKQKLKKASQSDDADKKQVESGHSSDEGTPPLRRKSSEKNSSSRRAREAEPLDLEGGMLPTHKAQETSAKVPGDAEAHDAHNAHESRELGFSCLSIEVSDGVEEGCDEDGRVDSPTPDTSSGDESEKQRGKTRQRYTAKRGAARNPGEGVLNRRRRRLREALEGASSSASSSLHKQGTPRGRGVADSKKESDVPSEERDESNWLDLKMQIEGFDCTPGAEGMAKDLFVNRDCFTIPSGKKVVHVSESGDFEFGTFETEVDQTSEAEAGKGGPSQKYSV